MNNFVSVQELPQKFRFLFNFENFNSMQSKCFPIIMNSNENMVVCAPTGSGKTTICELSFVKSCLTFNKASLMIYISPLRAICQERVNDWNKRFVNSNFDVKEYTGDTKTKIPNSLIKNTILCSTPEKFELATRSWKKKQNIFSLISVVVIDEIHTVGDKRGSILEALISRLIFISDHFRLKHEHHSIRIIALSATIPNFKDFAKWLRVPENHYDKTIFDNSFRSTKLTTKIFGYNENSNDWNFESSLTSRISTIIKQYMKEGPILIFCCTRKSCEKTATKIIFDFPELKDITINFENIKDKSLLLCLKGGVGFHSAGLSPNDREIVENLFKKNIIKILCTTSTLALGVNLPASVVIIKGTKFYSDSGLQDYDSTQIFQMMGRAGRPPYQNSGICIIMTEKSNVSKYEGIANNSNPIESTLLVNITDHINSECSLSTIHNLNNAIQWIKSTFLYIRLLQNPIYYNIKNITKKEEYLEEICLKSLKKLNKLGFIKIENNESIIPQPLGILSSQYGIHIDTMKFFNESLIPNDLNDLLQILTSASEFKDIIIRQDEKTKMKLLSVDPIIRYGELDTNDPLFLTPKNKVYLLIQIALGRGKLEDWNFSQEFIKIKKISERLLSCLSKLYTEKKSFNGCFYSLLLSKCISQQLWEIEEERISQQIKGIGEVYSKKIYSAGFKTIQSLRNIQCHEIEQITNHKHGWGISLIDNIKCIPNYFCEINIVSNNEFILFFSNLSDKDPLSKFHNVDILIGNTINDFLISKFHISKLTSHFSQSFKIFLTEKIDLNNIFIHIIDSEFIGIDESFALMNKIMKVNSNTNVSNTQKRTVALNGIVDDEEDVTIWELKPKLPNKIEINRNISELEIQSSYFSNSSDLSSDFLENFEFDDQI